MAVSRALIIWAESLRWRTASHRAGQSRSRTEVSIRKSIHVGLSPSSISPKYCATGRSSPLNRRASSSASRRPRSDLAARASPAGQPSARSTKTAALLALKRKPAVSTRWAPSRASSARSCSPISSTRSSALSRPRPRAGLTRQARASVDPTGSWSTSLARTASASGSASFSASSRTITTGARNGDDSSQISLSSPYALPGQGEGRLEGPIADYASRK